MAEAYVLAGELRDAGAITPRPSRATRSACGRSSTGKQRSAAKFASSFAPKSALGVTFRNLVTRLLRIPFLADRLLGRDLRDDFELPDYGM